MFDEKIILCVSNSYEEKYYFNDEFASLPKSIRDELKIMCVLFTEDIGGVLELVFNEDGELEFRASCDEGDLLYDDIGSGLKMRKLQRENQELLSALELYYQVMTGAFDEE